jgi:hypothetical protein
MLHDVKTCGGGDGGISIYLSIYLWLYIPCGPWPLFQFLNPYSRYDFSEGGSARRKAGTYTQNNTNKE